jgi:hypothetical protein
VHDLWFGEGEQAVEPVLDSKATPLELRRHVAGVVEAGVPDGSAEPEHDAVTTPVGRTG